MKRVSLKVARALKEAGYPQDKHNVGYVTEKCTDRFNVYHEGDLTDNASMMIKKISAPTYLKAWLWLWLWREKGKFIDIIKDCNGRFIALYGEEITESCEDSDPEKAIANAIDHLVDNDLIK